MNETRLVSGSNTQTDAIIFQQTLDPNVVLADGGLQPLGGPEITSKDSVP